MIVRIMGAEQYEVPEVQLHRLNVLDDLVAQAVEMRDADQLAALLDEMGELVRRAGTPVPTDQPRISSDFIVPGPHASIDEIVEWMGESRAEEGLIPD